MTVPSQAYRKGANVLCWVSCPGPGGDRALCDQQDGVAHGGLAPWHCCDVEGQVSPL